MGLQSVTNNPSNFMFKFNVGWWSRPLPREAGTARRCLCALARRFFCWRFSEFGLFAGGASVDKIQLALQRGSVIIDV